MHMAEVASCEQSSDRSGHCRSHDRRETCINCTQLERESSNSGGGNFRYTRELITFFLYGKIPPKSKRPWNESLSSKIAEVQESFKNIPPMLYFSPSSVSLNGIGVYATEPLPKATMLGPYFGRAIHKDQVEGQNHKIHNEQLWEVYQESSLAYFIDASDPRYGNWMNFIQCARSHQEQNLKALQHSGCLYFEATRDVVVGEELLVWYDENQYALYMGIPTGYRATLTLGDDKHPDMRNVTNQVPQTRESESCSVPGKHNSGAPNMTGLSDASTCSTGTDDSGISMSMEHNRVIAPLPTGDSGDQSTVPKYHSRPPPLQAATTYSTPDSHSENFQQTHADTTSAQRQTGHGQSYTDAPQVGSSQPSPAAGTLKPSPPHGVSSAQQDMWPLKSISKARAESLLYGMFSRSEDGTRWQCEECKRLFSSQGSLRAHARIHTGERPYQCQYCFRTFCQASTLRSHERLHTGEKPYKCEHCGRAFTQSAGLRSHLKTHRYD